MSFNETIQDFYHRIGGKLRQLTEADRMRVEKFVDAIILQKQAKQSKRRARFK